MKAPVIRRGSLLCLAYTALAGCVTPGETGGTRDSPVRASVIATTTEVGWRYDSSSGLIVNIGDFDGTNSTFTWPIDALDDEARMQKFEACLGEMRDNLRATRSAYKAEPHALHTAALACITSSGMPAYSATAGQNATEYEVELQAKGRREDLGLEVGFRPPSNEAPLVGYRHIRTQAAPPEVARDVSACASEASARSLFSTDRTVPGGNFGGLTAGGMTKLTIEPLIERFDGCMRDRGYVVQPTKA